MPEEFKTETAIARLERVHLKDDGNLLNDDHKTEETGFGPDHFYNDSLAKAASQKWLREDPEGVPAEEEWDPARSQVDQGGR